MIMNYEVSANAILKRATRYYTVMIKSKVTGLTTGRYHRRAAAGHPISRCWPPPIAHQILSFFGTYYSLDKSKDY